MNGLERTNHRGELLDPYGRKEVYSGSAHPVGERYLVWLGRRWPDGSESFQGAGTFRTLRQAIREARRWERKGFDTRITDRLITEEA